MIINLIVSSFLKSDLSVLHDFLEFLHIYSMTDATEAVTKCSKEFYTVEDLIKSKIQNC